MDKANWILNAAKSKLQDAYQQHLQPLTQPLAQTSPLQSRRGSGAGLPLGLALGQPQPQPQPQVIQASSIQSLDARSAKFKHELLEDELAVLLGHDGGVLGVLSEFLG